MKSESLITLTLSAALAQGCQSPETKLRKKADTAIAQLEMSDIPEKDAVIKAINCLVKNGTIETSETTFRIHQITSPKKSGRYFSEASLNISNRRDYSYFELEFGDGTRHHYGPSSYRYYITPESRRSGSGDIAYGNPNYTPTRFQADNFKQDVETDPTSIEKEHVAALEKIGKVLSSNYTMRSGCDLE